MNDIGVIDRFTDVFSSYINSGFGLLGRHVGFLSATLIAIDMTLAGLWWAWSSGGDDVIARLVKKVLYVGAFAFIIGNFNWLATLIFRSFAALGLTASSARLSQADLLRPGQLATVGVDAGRPILEQIGVLGGFPGVFLNLDMVVVLFLAWLIVIVSFFVLAVQLFVTLIEFKLTTLAGFVLVPFAFWGKTAFLAERVLGNVMSSGVKVLVLAVIIGIGSGLFADFRIPPGADPSIDHALATMLASLALLGLGIFGPGIAAGLVSGGPQLGAGAVAGTALGVTGAAAASVGLVAGGAGLAARTLRGGAGALSAATSVASNARSAYVAGAAASGGSGMRSVVGGVANTLREGAGAVAQRARGMSSGIRGGGTGAVDAAGASGADAPPAWARRLQRRQQVAHGATMAAHSLRAGDHGGSGAGPSLRNEER